MLSLRELFEIAAVLIGLGLGAYAVVELRAFAADTRRGRLVSVDVGPEAMESLRSRGWRIAGRPDEIRQLPDGRWVPIEWKTRAAPRSGPLPSHRMQLLAYCLLCEARTGRPPPYGILRYGDGTEIRVPWDAAARTELWQLRQELDRPYDGRHRASPSKCAGCRWRSICDVRAA